MKLCVVLLLIISGLIAASTLIEHRTFTTTENNTVPGNIHSTPVVVIELFTSEGCSSCPPADDLLSRLDQQPITGVEIIGLSEHVDYWNRLGWHDPYSSPEFSKRQNVYADAFLQHSVYTPQMVVDGRQEFVGGNETKAKEAIVTASKTVKATVQLNFTDTSHNSDKEEIALSINVSDLPPIPEGDFADIVVAITENSIATNVLRGENAGRFLRHSDVVRQLNVVGEIPLGKRMFALRHTLHLSREWQRGNLRVVAFVQGHRTRYMLGAAAMKLSTV